MDKILNRICSIDNHPIAQLDEKFRIQYVEGLIACMYSISNGSDIAKMITYAWTHPIYASKNDLLWKNDVEAVKRAISIKRKGIKFFYMRESFFFDVFYLTQASDLGNSNFNKVSEYLRQNVCGYFSKKSLNKIFLAYKQNSSSIDGVSSAQIKHRNTNNKILSGTEKRDQFILHKLFGDIVYRTELHAFHCGMHFGIVGHDNEGLHLSLLSHPAQKVYTVTVRQMQVGNHDVIIRCLLQMFLRG